MPQFRTIEERAREEREAARRRDGHDLSVARLRLTAGTVLGAALGLAIALLPRIDGSTSLFAGVAIVVLSSAICTYASLAKLEVLTGMVLYPALMIPLVIVLRVKGSVICDDAVAFAMILMILLGMSCSYTVGWIRSQPGE